MRFALLVLLLVLSVGTATARDLKLSLHAVEWLEHLPDGTLFVRERGLRVDGTLRLPLLSGKRLTLDYLGSGYLSLVRHQGWDRTRITIPQGYESSVYVGQAGTAHFLTVSGILLDGPVSVRPELALGFDSWYRPLDYYEIWLVPMARYGIHLSPGQGNRWALFLGASSMIEPTQYTQTTKSPWNASNNITQHLQGRTSPVFSLAWKLPRGARVEVGYFEYRFKHGPVTILDSGIGIFQPASRLRALSASYILTF